MNAKKSILLVKDSEVVQQHIKEDEFQRVSEMSDEHEEILAPLHEEP